MLDLSPDKLFMLAIVAVVILGPNRLPGAARALGRLIGQMRSMSASLQTEVREALSDHDEAFTSALAEFRPGDVRRSVRKAVTNTIAPLEPGSIRRAVSEATQLPASTSAVAAQGFVAPAPASFDLRPNPDDPALN